VDKPGAGAEKKAAEQPADPMRQRADLPTKRNLNVISSYAPGEIARIKQKFLTSETKFLTVEQGETLVDALTAYVARIRAHKQFPHDPEPPFDNLDLIGHSRTRDHILKLGELALTSAVAREQFKALDDRGVLDVLEITAVRLLGCRTASHPRGENVVRAIHAVTEIDVYATLFAVHYGSGGLCRDAELLLADQDVILKSGAGDLPPSDDYLPDLPDDDSDEIDGVDTYDGGAAVPPLQPPDRFSFAVLSEANASKMSAAKYLWWQWSPVHVAGLVELLHADWSAQDNPLLRAEYEVLLPASSSTSPRDTADIRSFDLFLTGKHPRLRVNRGGESFAFSFKLTETVLRAALNRIGIRVEVPALP
jgi:hypothetical protein